jgi:hypothetical protein
MWGSLPRSFLKAGRSGSSLSAVPARQTLRLRALPKSTCRCKPPFRALRVNFGEEGCKLFHDRQRKSGEGERASQARPLRILASSHGLSLSARPVRRLELAELVRMAGALGAHTLDSAALIVPPLEGTFARITRTLGMLVGHGRNMCPDHPACYPDQGLPQSN